MEKSKQELQDQKRVTFDDLEEIADRLKSRELFPEKMKEARRILARMEHAEVPVEFGKR